MATTAVVVEVIAPTLSTVSAIAIPLTLTISVPVPIAIAIAIAIAISTTRSRAIVPPRLFGAVQPVFGNHTAELVQLLARHPASFALVAEPPSPTLAVVVIGIVAHPVEARHRPRTLPG
jgi:hypothetical protein